MQDKINGKLVYLPVQFLLTGIEIANARLHVSIPVVCNLVQPNGIVGENKIAAVSSLCIVIVGVKILKTLINTKHL
jgi:hypothetical protein